MHTDVCFVVCFLCCLCCFFFSFRGMLLRVSAHSFFQVSFVLSFLCRDLLAMACLAGLAPPPFVIHCSVFHFVLAYLTVCCFASDFLFFATVCFFGILCFALNRFISSLLMSFCLHSLRFSCFNFLSRSSRFLFISRCAEPSRAVCSAVPLFGLLYYTDACLLLNLFFLFYFLSCRVFHCRLFFTSCCFSHLALRCAALFAVPLRCISFLFVAFFCFFGSLSFTSLRLSLFTLLCSVLLCFVCCTALACRAQAESYYLPLSWPVLFSSLRSILLYVWSCGAAWSVL